MNKTYFTDIENIANHNLPWTMLSSKIILITGASGFLGRFLIHVLMYRNTEYKQNITIIALGRNEEKLKSQFKSYLDNKYFTYICRDISKSFNFPDADIIIHAASNTHPKEYALDPIGTITTNIFGTFNLLSSIRNYTQFVLLSSVEIYGESFSDKSFSEKDCGYLDCNTLRAGYPESKRLSEALCQAFLEKNKNLYIGIARLCRVYGPSDSDDSKASAQFIRNAVNKKNIILKSSGTQVYSYIYYADAILALLYILFYGKNGEAYNIANESVSLFDFANTVASIAGTQVVFKQGDELEKIGASKVTKSILDTRKLFNLGWEPKTDLITGIKRTIKILTDECCTQMDESTLKQLLIRYPNNKRFDVFNIEINAIKS